MRQVQFVVQRGFAGALWYIGNEDGAAEPANMKRIATHVTAMKHVDPTMRVMWNDNEMDATKLRSFLSSAAGPLMDGVEFHGKWPFGGSPHLDPASVETYLEEVPLIDHKMGVAWRDKIAPLRAAAKEMGKTSFLLANNEYGLGKPSAFVGLGTNWTRYLKSLVAVEFALEMIVGGYDIAAFWDNGDGRAPSNATANAAGSAQQLGASLNDHMLLDTDAAWRMNPMHIGFELLAAAQRGARFNVTTSAKRVHGFAVSIPAADAAAAAAAAAGVAAATELALFVLNKYTVPIEITVALPTGRACGAPTTHALASMVDTQDHWGSMLRAEGGVTCRSSGAAESAQCSCVATLPALSLSRADLV